MRFGIFVLVLVDELNAARINFISNVIRNDFVRCVVCGSVVFYCIAKRRFCILCFVRKMDKNWSSFELYYPYVEVRCVGNFVTVEKSYSS